MGIGISSVKGTERVIYRQYGECPTLETRHDSNETVDRQKRYREILEILNKFKQGLTAKEIAVAMKRMGYTKTDERNLSAPRLTELCAMGFVEPLGKTKCKYSGKTVTVYGLREE